ncbi:hypothetical protein NADFUDRAFT_48254 [Nadsonia fulvescens var. elongata DSM 6958]|uniref:Uncharacterized protein n=1 Tax=Nadsonia fulvescens var. elongata DSM 6958 TaxID=857566 RepID=A0A1E3PDB2_9ASCO|nr:hypothetical protein NADFUDRAFT_48254 [Nadsonia fulvescens var. elongata DSM 6958]
MFAIDRVDSQQIYAACVAEHPNLSLASQTSTAKRHEVTAEKITYGKTKFYSYNARSKSR